MMMTDRVAVIALQALKGRAAIDLNLHEESP
jgi:hypothetical protein